MGGVGRLVVGGVYVVDAGLQAGVHDVQVLIGKGEIEDDVRPEPLYESGQLRDIVGVYARRLNLPAVSTGESFLDRLGLPIVLLATTISLKTSGTCAHLCAATVATPPAPIIIKLPRLFLSFMQTLREILLMFALPELLFLPDPYCVP